MPIALLRLDERLIHGQVVVGWGERVHMDRIVVIDDQLSQSAWEQDLYCLGVPTAVTAEFVSVQQARARYPEWQRDPHHFVILMRDVATLERLAEDGLLQGAEVNLGGIHSAPGRERVLPYLFLSAEEKEALRRVADEGAEITARDLPMSRGVSLDDLLHGH